jgi:protease-4
MNKSNNTGKIVLMIIVILLVLCFCCGSLLVLASLSDTSGSSLGLSKKTVMAGNADQEVAIITISGVIDSTSPTDLWGNSYEDMVSKAVRELDNAQHDDKVKGVILRIDSPGGVVYDAKTIYNKIVEVKAAKPIVVQMQSMAASGGYYIAAPTNHIIASESTMTGSIGVILSTLDYTELYNKIGIEEINIVNTKGNLKVVEDLSDENGEGYKVLQALADDVYDDFVGVVATGRGMTVTEVETLADGRVYSGKQAFDNGLVDELGEDTEAYAAIERIAELNDPTYVEYTDELGSFSRFSVRLASLLNPEAALLNKRMDQKLQIMYLMSF